MPKPRTKKKDETVEPWLGMEGELLAEFRSSEREETLDEATMRYIDANRGRFGESQLKFLAACAIQAGDGALAAVLLGRDAISGKKRTVTT